MPALSRSPRSPRRRSPSRRSPNRRSPSRSRSPSTVIIDGRVARRRIRSPSPPRAPRTASYRRYMDTFYDIVDDLETYTRLNQRQNIKKFSNKLIRHALYKNGMYLQNIINDREFKHIVKYLYNADQNLQMRLWHTMPEP